MLLYYTICYSSSQGAGSTLRLLAGQPQVVASAQFGGACECVHVTACTVVCMLANAQLAACWRMHSRKHQVIAVLHGLLVAVQQLHFSAGWATCTVEVLVCWIWCSVSWTFLRVWHVLFVLISIFVSCRYQADAQFRT